MRNVIRGVVTLLVTLVFTVAVSACPWCRAQVKNGVYDQGFFGNLLMLLLPIFILAAIGFGLYHADKISNKIRRLK
jgi:apolipoprotein N-acyltransferase